MRIWSEAALISITVSAANLSDSFIIQGETRAVVPLEIELLLERLPPLFLFLRIVGKRL